MIIKKKSQTFNTYSCEISWGQLNAIYAALEKDHADPLADELFAEIGWYMQNVPGPGEDEEEYKEAKEAEKAAIEGDEEGAGAGPDQEFLGQEVEGPPTEDQAGGPFAETSEEADRLLERPPEREPEPEPEPVAA
jgi:hypothetical protein